MTAQQFIDKIKSVRFVKDDEKKVQAKIAEIFPLAKREYFLSRTDKIDFIFLDSGLGIEVKIKGQPTSVVRQLNRYATSKEITQLILVTAKSVNIPSEMQGKKVFKFNINQAWL